MNAENRCSACNAELAANAPRGLCPACLLKGGLGTQTGGTGRSDPSQTGDFVPPTPAELAPYFPDLEILELVGRGGMGVVYKARQKRLDRLVALKILAPKIEQDPAFAERFAREARAMAMLSHSHVVAVRQSAIAIDDEALLAMTRRQAQRITCRAYHAPEPAAGPVSSGESSPPAR